MKEISSYQADPISIRSQNIDLFIWLDILGFSEAVSDEKRYKELAKLLVKFQRLFDGIAGCQAHIISDGFILYFPTPSPDRVVEIFEEIGKKQLQFILENGVFIRGGIAFGSKLPDKKDGTDNHWFISNGLALAVKVESHITSWPVVGTTKKVLKKYHDAFGVEENEYFGLKQTLNSKGEEILFIDFLNQRSQELYGLIVENIRTFHDKPGIRSKYIWLLRYYHFKFGNAMLPDDLKGIVL